MVTVQTRTKDNNLAHEHSRAREALKTTAANHLLKQSASLYAPRRLKNERGKAHTTSWSKCKLQPVVDNSSYTWTHMISLLNTDVRNSESNVAAVFSDRTTTSSARNQRVVADDCRSGNY